MTAWMQSRPVARALLLLALVLVAGSCGGGGEASSPASPASPSSDCPGGREFTVVVKDVDFDADCYSAPPNTALTITFTNQDAGVQHNLVIRRGEDRNLFEGDLVTGVTTVRYEVPPLAAGEYHFFCVIHPLQMAGTFRVG
jgi:plastocyanin